MRILIAFMALWVLGGCTSVGEVRQDAGEAREAFKESLARSAQSVSERDLMVRDVHQVRNRILMRAAEDSARGDDVNVEGINRSLVWLDKAEESAKTYDPFGDKARNVKRVWNTIREDAPEPESPPETR